jgi:hypothetical protein
VSKGVLRANRRGGEEELGPYFQALRQRWERVEISKLPGGLERNVDLLPDLVPPRHFAEIHRNMYKRIQLTQA